MRLLSKIEPLMMNRHYKTQAITLTFLLQSLFSTGQDSAGSIYRFTSNIFRSFDLDTTEFRFQTCATNLTFVGQYMLASHYADLDPSSVQTISNAKKTEFLNTYHPVDARSYIIEKAKLSQVVIINEAHYNARHRVFAASLLKSLKQIGYKYFAAETFINDSSLFSGKHPNIQSGFYTREPCYGNLVRTAIDENYKLVPYETNHLGIPRDREIDQAQNLSNIFKKDPSAKMIVYCGFAHIREDDTLSTWGRAMAGRLKQYTGIDPFTIDQIELSEHSDKTIESPYYNLVTSTNYSILVDKDNLPFHTKGIDACVYSPRCSIELGRPSWLKENNRSFTLLKPTDSKLSYPILIRIFLSGDDPKLSVPIDVIEIQKESDFTSIAASIPTGKNIIAVYEGQNGKTETQTIHPK